MQIKTPSPLTSTSIATTTESTNSPVAISISAHHQSGKVLINLTPPKQPTSSINGSSERRAPLDVCCVIDVSGSMGSEAPIPGDPATGSQLEKTGLTVLDIVKHSLRTIITTMKDGEQNSLGLYSASPSV